MATKAIVFDIVMDVPGHRIGKSTQRTKPKNSGQAACSLTMFAVNVIIQAWENGTLLSNMTSATVLAKRNGVNWNPKKCTVSRMKDRTEILRKQITGIEVETVFDGNYYAVKLLALEKRDPGRIDSIEKTIILNHLVKQEGLYSAGLKLVVGEARNWHIVLDWPNGQYPFWISKNWNHPQKNKR